MRAGRQWLLVILFVIGEQSLLVTCLDSCWEGVNQRNCIINAKFHNINTYDVHILCTAEDEGRDSGDRFQKVYHAELNGCLTYKNTNPFELLPRNMNNLKKLTLNEFYIGILTIHGSSAPHLPKLEELILRDNVITAYSSDFYAAQSINHLKVIQFAGPETSTPNLEQLSTMKELRSFIIRQGNILINYEVIGQIGNLNNLEIYSSNVTVTPVDNSTAISSVTSLILEDSHILNSTLTLLDVMRPFSKISYLKIRNTTSAALSTDEFVTLDVTSTLNAHPQLSSLVVQHQNLSQLIIDLQILTKSRLQTLDISYNLLDEIDWKWDANLAKVLIDKSKLKLIIDHNPWHCEFFQHVNEELFEYEKDYNAINVRGLNCRHNSTKGAASHHLSNRPLDLSNMWLLYGCVLSSLLLLISITYLVCAMCRSKRREPFYRSLVKWKRPTRPVADLTMRKLPPTNYETPLQYRTIEFKSEDNCEIYEEIPANLTGQTLQVII